MSGDCHRMQQTCTLNTGYDPQEFSTTTSIRTFVDFSSLNPLPPHPFRRNEAYTKNKRTADDNGGQLERRRSYGRYAEGSREGRPIRSPTSTRSISRAELTAIVGPGAVQPISIRFAYVSTLEFAFRASQVLLSQIPSRCLLCHPQTTMPNVGL